MTKAKFMKHLKKNYKNSLSYHVNTVVYTVIIYNLVKEISKRVLLVDWGRFCYLEPKW